MTLPVICGVIYPWIEVEGALRFLGLHASFLGSPVGSLALSALDRSLWAITRLTLRFYSLWTLAPAWIIGGSLIISGIFTLFKFKWRYRLATLVVFILLRLAVTEREALIKPASPTSIRAREVIQLDVGQGDSALVLTKDSAGLIDAGSVHGLSDTQWIHLLALNQVDHLSWVVLTHLDEDHRGGLSRLSRLIPIDCVATSRQEFDTDRGIRFARELLAHRIRVASQGCAPFPVRAPTEASASGHRLANANMSAIVIPLLSGDTYISAGDAEKDDEVKIARWADSLIRNTQTSAGKRIFKISHHGSDTSTDPRVLEILHPDFAVISAGVGNPYGHPSSQVLSRLEHAQIPFCRTDRDGAIRITKADDRRRPREHRP